MCYIRITGARTVRLPTGWEARLRGHTQATEWTGRQICWQGSVDCRTSSFRLWLSEGTARTFWHFLEQKQAVWHLLHIIRSPVAPQFAAGRIQSQAHPPLMIDSRDGKIGVHTAVPNVRDGRHAALRVSRSPSVDLLCLCVCPDFHAHSTS